MHVETVAGVVRAHAAARPGKDAVRAGSASMTFAELDARANQVAHALLAEGVGPGDRVAYLDANALEYFAMLYGAAKIGAVFVPLNWRLAPLEVAEIVADAEPRLAVVGPSFKRPPVPVIEVGEDFKRWTSARPTVDPDGPSRPEDIVVLYYSSGTTGRPKGVMLSNENVVLHSHRVSAAWRMHEGAIALAAMPLFHVGGGGFSAAATYAGATVDVLREVTPDTAWEALRTRNITHTFFAPTMIQAMLQAQPEGPLDLALEILVYGASPIAESVLAEAISVFGPVFFQSYGLTEVSGAAVHLPPEDHDPTGPRRHLLRSAGRPAQGVDLAVVDPTDGRVLGPHEVGEVLLRTRQNMQGYWKRPDETAQVATPDGWLHTGDAGYVDEDGYLYLHDRIKDMIVSGGENIFPAEVENVLMAHPGVADVAVIGVPHHKWGETPCALVVRAADVDVSHAELLAHSRANLATYKCPTSVEWVESLPRNAAGKVQKKELRAPYWEGRERFVT